MRPRRALIALAAVALTGALATSAHAAVPLAPAWSVPSVAVPTNFKPGDKKGDYFYEVLVTNSGGKATDGSNIVLTDTLPVGLTVKSVELLLPAPGDSQGNFGAGACSIVKAGGVSTVTCTVSEGIVGADEPALVGPSEHLTAVIHVTPGSAGPLVNLAQVQGGGVPGTVSEQSANEASGAAVAAGFSEFRATVTDGEGKPVSGAASHPFQLTTSFAVNTSPAPAGSHASFLPAGGDVKDIEVALPPGLVGNPTEVARCTPHQFTTVHQVSKGGSNVFINECPEGSAIGVVTLRQIEGHLGEIGLGGGPIYNLVPPKGMPAQFGFQAAGAPFYVDAELRNGSDYGVSAHLRNTSEAKRISAASVTIWGVPAESSHDGLRGSCAELGGSCSAEEPEPKPFLRLPSSCDAALATLMSFNTWTEPGIQLSREAVEAAPVGCDRPDFSPTFGAKPTSEIADSPTGLDVDLHFPQKANEEDPEGVAEADLRDATVTLPEGLLVNPASADGLASCSLAQIGFEGVKEGVNRFSPDAAACPDASKIGSVEVETPLIENPLPGAVYLAKQGENPFNSLLAIYITVDDPQSGVVVKLPGKVIPDPVTGRLTTIVSAAPQAPFEDFKLNFFAGARAPLRTPAACGKYTTTTDLKPWSAPESGPDATSSSTFQVDSGPAGPCSTDRLDPKLSAGLANPSAGAHTPFELRLSRADGSGQFAALTATTPPGLTAKLKGIPYCPQAGIDQAAARTQPGQGAAEVSSPSCPAASQVGSAIAGSGAGPNPFHVAGEVYLAGPYRGAPLSLVAIVPALAGPFDLGVVTDRVALNLNPETAQVSAESDRFPTILAGIPLDVREIRVSLDRPDFTVAPTNCEPMSIGATVLGVSGAVASLSERFQVGGCDALAFAPKLSLRLKGGTKRSDYPALRAELTAKVGEGNIGRVSVALPHSEFLAQEHLNTICTRVQFAADACPKGSIYGKARAFTPLLDKPLDGPVYLRSSSHAVPDMVAALNGQIDIDLVGRIDSIHGGIRTTFDTVPDAPVSKFVLELKGGVKSLLVNSRDICANTNRATVKMTAQSGKEHDFRPLLRDSCRASKRAKRH